MRLRRDDFSSNRHHASAHCLSMIFSENRYTLFGIMLWMNRARRWAMAPNAPAVPETLPRVVPALLSFIAGYVDSCTFLALFGLYVAQLTGSFVLAGTEAVVHDNAAAIKFL